MKKKYNQIPIKNIAFRGKQIPSFVIENANDLDLETVESFGEEWDKFSMFSDSEIKSVGDEYFDILPSDLLKKSSYVLDVGCGSGRWSKYLIDYVGFIECIDPSKAVFSALNLLKGNDNVRIAQASVGNIPFDNETFDLVMSIGVLHHIPDTVFGIRECVKKVKKGGYFYVYLYYNLDNRGFLYKSLFITSIIVRKIISSFPSFLKIFFCDLIAFLVYLPLVFVGTLVKRLFGKIYKKLPLSYYVGKSINIIRNDALDRFGTPLEKRFTKKEIRGILEEVGLTNIQFSNFEPYWHVIGQKI